MQVRSDKQRLAMRVYIFIRLRVDKRNVTDANRLHVSYSYF